MLALAKTAKFHPVSGRMSQDLSKGLIANIQSTRHFAKLSCFLDEVKESVSVDGTIWLGTRLTTTMKENVPHGSDDSVHVFGHGLPMFLIRGLVANTKQFSEEPWIGHNRRIERRGVFVFMSITKRWKEVEFKSN